MKKGFIIIALFVVLTLYIVNKVNAARQLEFTIGLPLNIHIEGGSVVFILPLKAQNVTQTAINVKSLDFDVSSAGRLLGKAILNSPVTIVPANFTVLPVSVTISLFNLATAASSVVSLFKAGKVNLSLDGLVYAEGFQVPVSTSFDFDYKNVLS